MSKQFRSLTRDYILSKYFDYYLIKKDKVLVVAVLPFAHYSKTSILIFQ